MNAKTTATAPEAISSATGQALLERKMKTRTCFNQWWIVGFGIALSHVCVSSSLSAPPCAHHTHDPDPVCFTQTTKRHDVFCLHTRRAHASRPLYPGRRVWRTNVVPPLVALRLCWVIRRFSQPFGYHRGLPPPVVSHEPSHTLHCLPTPSLAYALFSPACQTPFCLCVHMSNLHYFRL